MATLPRSLTVRPVRLQGRLEETRYKKSDDGLRYKHESNADLWLIETKDGRRGTLAMPRRGQGWTRDGETTWLTNAPERAPMAKRRSRFKKGSAAARAYMAKIRPNKGRRKVAKAKRRSSGKKRRAVARRSVVLINSPKRRNSRRGHRRNPPALSVAGALGRVTAGAMGGATIVATEIAQRLIRGRALGMKAGELLSDAVELGVSTAAGLAAEHFLGGNTGARYGQLIVDAGFASVLRARIKQSKAPWVADALADDGRRMNFEVRNGRVIGRGSVNGYVPGRAPANNVALNGYVPGREQRPLGGYVPGAGAAEMAAAFRSATG